jgi:hypothetical protein
MDRREHALGAHWPICWKKSAEPSARGTSYDGRFNLKARPQRQHGNHHDSNQRPYLVDLVDEEPPRETLDDEQDERGDGCPKDDVEKPAGESVDHGELLSLASPQRQSYYD